ncbi:MAG TPA: nucleoside-diphosphate kinase [Polyangiales bacterium]|nr:nucleoside-diphosphate kinase [Polyangiales bacterium]
MAIERTLSILKPDTVEKNNIGNVLAVIEKAGLKVVAAKLIHLSLPQAEGFYAEHKGRGFFGELVQFMTRGPVLVAVLEGENAIATYRKVMGATNPANADEGTIRKLYAKDVGENAVHGSDSAESAKREVSYYFPGYEIL